MPSYLVLLYANEAEPEEQKRRDSETDEWTALSQSLAAEGVLVGANRLHSVDTATTVRVRDGETQVTDGPFAVTKEFLAGYYLLECADLDEALRHAARMPLARYGSVEVRPVMDMSAEIREGAPAAQA